MEGASETALAAQNAAQSAAQDAVQAAALSVPSYSWSGYFMGLALLFLLLGMLWFGARFLRQKGGMRFFGQTSALNVESRLALSPRKHLLVIKYRNKRLLLGVTEHNISLLAEDPLEEGENPGGEEGTQGAFGGGHAGIGEKFKDMLHDFNKRK